MANTKIPSELVAINAISGTLIADNAITSVHIAENNITATQIAINAVTALQMADGTITSAKIADGTIVTADIADGQITTGKLADSSVTTGKIAAGTIASSDIANNAILTQHIDDNQITADQIADNAVGVDQLAGIARGKIIVGNAAGNPSLLALGAANTLLQSDGTDLVFAPLQSGIDDNSNAVAITIDSSENVLVGKTSNTLSAAGAKLGTGGSNFTRDNSEVVYVNRTTSDGSLITLAKDGTSVGSIGTVGGDLAIYSTSSTHAGLRFLVNGILPTNNAGTINNNTVDLGGTSNRFKDLYLSGNIAVGGTVDGVDIQTLNTTAGAALPKAGGTLTGGIVVGGDTSINRGNQTAGELLIGGTTDGGFLDFDGTSLQLNTQRDPNTGTFINTSKSHGGITISGASADSHIKFYTASANNTTGTERMRIDKNGNLGINCTSPATKFVVQHTNGGTGIEFSMGADLSYLQCYSRSASDYKSLKLDAEEIRFGTNDGTERMRIQSDGVVHITSAGSPIAPTIKHGGGTGDVSKLRLINRSGQGADKGGIVEFGAVTNDDVTRSDVFATIGGLKDNATSGNKAGYMQFMTSNGSSLAEKMRLDSNGNVGIGTSSPAKELHVYAGTAGGILSEATQDNTLSFKTTSGGTKQWNIGNYYTTWNSLASPFILQPINGSGTMDICLTPVTNTPTKGLVIKASGCIGLGTTADRSLGTNITTTVTSGSAGSGFWMSTGNSSATSSKIISSTNGSVGDLLINQGSGANGGSIRFSSQDSEKMRINSNGSVEIGSANNAGSLKIINTSADVLVLDRRGSDGTVVLFRNDDTNVGGISVSGSSVVYNTSSDYRLKENAEPIQNGLERLNQLNPVKFDWKEDGTSSEGFIAHEVQEIFPDAVSGEKDAETMQGMDYGRITPLLVKAIQEQQTLIETLQREVQELKDNG